ncbi:hypothetical protein JCM18899A_37910 [Nocardioides sp. AN3]
MMEDRREPVARYVVFADGAVQRRFAEVAESTYQDLARLDEWAGPSTLELPDTERSHERRGLLRRASRETPVETLAVTSGLAAAGETGRDVPARIAAMGGCAAERDLSATMGRVVLELVRDLAGAAVGEQREHLAYRQTQRLAAELQALRVVLSEVGCQQPEGCVHLRPPEQWGRRVEDVEVAEVRAVLLELAERAESGANH